MDDPEDDHMAMAELEANLYAQIHHDAPESVEQFSAEDKIQQQQQNLVSVPIPNRLVTNSSVVNNNNAATSGGPKKGRYWEDGSSGGQKAKVWNPMAAGKGRRKSTPAGASSAGPAVVPLSNQPAASSVDYRPKPFTPYTSYLSQIGTTPVALPSTISATHTPDVVSNETVQAPDPGSAPPPGSLTYQEIRAVLKKKNRQNRQKKNKELNKNDPDRRPNPFNRLVETKLQNVQRLRCKKEKASVSSAKASAKVQQKVETINLDSDDEEENDDVICIPVPPPPLVCIESSDEEEVPKSEETPAVAEPVEDGHVITEDFIEQRDRNRLSQDEDAFAGLGDDELSFSTVEQAINASIGAKDCSEVAQPVTNSDVSIQGNNNSTGSNPAATPDNSTEDIIIVATPQKTATTPTYEVTENGFAAVDIYESESSDFPESIYERGKKKESPTTNDLFDSDVSDIELNIENRLKRRSKRKSCSSNRGSDYMSCSEDEDDDNSDTDAHPAFIESIRSTSTPCVQRGAAVATSKSKIIRPPNASAKRKKHKSMTEHSSDEEFVSMLSCIVHDDKNGTNDSSGEILSQDLIGARSIVEQTLKKVSEKKNEGTAKKTSTWVITDEVAGDTNPTTTDQLIAAIDEFVVMDSVGETDPVPGIALDGPGEGRDEMQVNDAIRDEDGQDESNDDDTSVPSCSLIVDNPELCWNDEVRSFYNKSWGGENHDQAAIYRGLSKNRSDWKIGDSDLFPSTPQTSKRFNARNLRCNNCREKGHRYAECPLPPKTIQCHMCGETGHREPRCPNTLCLRCGNKTNLFSRSCSRCLMYANTPCHLCKAKGHYSRDCPDRWRRYHSTTKPNVSLRQVPFINKQKYCCVCASPGHLAEYCRHALRIMDTPAQPIKIRSYAESYDRLPDGHVKPDGSQMDDVAPFAFVSVPQEHYKFNWDVNEEPHRVYGRIIKATQMQRTELRRISNKRRLSANDKEHKSKARRKSKDGDTATKHLVLNPLNALKNKCTKTKVNNEGEENQAPSEALQKIVEGIRNNEMPDEPESTTDSLSHHDEVAPPTQITKPDIVDDAFAQILDIAAIDEAVRIHEETQHTLRSNEPISDRTMDKFSFVSALSEVEQPNETKLDKTMDNFSFVSALSEVEQAAPPPKTFIIAALQSDKTHEEIPAEPTLNESNNISFATANEESVVLGETSETRVEVDSDKRVKTPPPPIITFSDISQRETLEICAEMQRLERQEQMLNKLKETLKSKKKTKRVSERVTDIIEDAIGYHVVLNEDIDKEAEAQKNVPEYDSDSNYSFSDYFAKQKNITEEPDTSSPMEEEVEPVTKSIQMPDFIPIGGNDDDDDDIDMSFLDNVGADDSSVATSSAISVPEKGPSKPIAPVDPSQYSEAKIYLTKDHSKYLLTRSGGAFLTETYTKHNVVVRMEWRNIGNILIVQGSQSAQDKFHADLIAYCASAEEEIRKKQEISQQVPKNRLTLIRFIKEQIGQLEKQLGNVKECFVRMKISEQQRSKTGTKNADKARRTLNMILLGQTGLRDGPMHLTALQSNLRCLIENETKELISNAFRNEVFQHFKYIFSSFAHDDYDELVTEYENMRKSKQLPVLRLDRRLLGIKIDVAKPVVAPAHQTETLQVVADNSDVSNRVVTLKHVPASKTILPAPKSEQTPKKSEQTPKKMSDSSKTHAADELSGAVPLLPKLKPEHPTEDADMVNTLDIDTPATTNDNPSAYVRSADTMPSMIWSLKCSEYINKCKAIPKIAGNEKAMDKLRRVEVKANSGAMSYNDFRMLMRIFDQCQ